MPRQNFLISNILCLPIGDCRDCSEKLSDDFITVENSPLCDICERDTFICDRCNKNFYQSDVNKVGDDDICEDCFDKFTCACSWCEIVVYSNKLTYCQSDRICRICRDDDSFCCSNCDERFHNDEYGGDGECNSCWQSNNDSSSFIQKYETKNYFAPLGKGPRFLGVELELETNEDCDREYCAEKVFNTVNNFCILKEDGSLDDGFEIVSCPATLDKHKNLWDDLFRKLGGLIADDNCGMHVHVSKKSLTILSITKIVKFCNSRANAKFIEFIAGRYNDSYAVTTDENEIYKKVKENKIFRNSLVNIIPTDTIEFRMFAATTNLNTFISRLEFVDALCEYVRNTSIKDLSVEGFYCFTCGKKEYSKINNYIKNYAEQ